jgi:hypothetical protein
MFNINYNPVYKSYSNKSIEWCPMDTKILYEKNIEEEYNLLKSNGWVNSNFKYTFNSHGFRCEEFTDDPTIMFLGCSYTFGIGLPIENVWSTLVAKKLNMHCANLAIGGGASDTAFRLCYGWIDKIKPKIVIFLEPPSFRIEIVNNTKQTVINANYTGPYEPFIKDWVIDENNIYLNNQKNQLAIKSLCDTRNIKYLFLSFDDFSMINDDYARDLCHPGVKSHQLFANNVLEKFGSLTLTRTEDLPLIKRML